MCIYRDSCAFPLETRQNNRFHAFTLVSNFHALADSLHIIQCQDVVTKSYVSAFCNFTKVYSNLTQLQITGQGVKNK